MRRAAFVPLMVLAAASVLTGCGGLPTPAGVRSVRTVAPNEPRDEPVFRRIPAGPQSGQSPAEVAAAFLRAGAAPDVAKQFLAPGSSWDPETLPTVVFTGTLPLPRAAPVAGAPGRQLARVAVDALLDIATDGSTSPALRSPRPVVELALIRDSAGDWRVAVPPDVLLVRDTDLQQARRRVVLGWLGPDEHLVRDSVLLPVPDDDLPSAVVGALLQGPPRRLTQVGVTTRIPPLTKAVRVALEGGTLSVDLDATALSIPPSATALVRAQIAATLQSLPNVGSVVLRVQGQPLLLPGRAGDTPVTVTDAAAYDPGVPAPGLAPLALGAKGSLGPIDPAGRAPAGRAPPGRAPGGTLEGLAVDADGRRTARLQTTAGGVDPQLLQTPDATSPSELAGPGPWTSVAFGRDSSLWLVRGGQVLERPRDGTLQPVRTPVALRRLVIAPDGVHAVGITADSGLVAGVVGLPQPGRPAVLALRPVAPAVRDAVDVAFDSSDGDVVVLRDGADGDAPGRGTGSAALVSVDAPDPDGGDLVGDVRALPVPCPRAQAAAVTGRPREAPLVGCPDGTVRRLEGQTWAPVGVGRFPTWPLG